MNTTMKKFSILLLVILCFSCKKEKYTTEGLFLENLKETSTLYEYECKVLMAKIENRYNDYGKKNTEFDTLKIFTSDLEKLFVKIKDTDRGEMIKYETDFVQKWSDFDGDCKIKPINTDKLEVLNNETGYFYIKTVFYKNLMENLNKHFSKMPIYCGYTVLSKHKQELIDIIKYSDIK